MVISLDFGYQSLKFDISGNDGDQVRYGYHLQEAFKSSRMDKARITESAKGYQICRHKRGPCKRQNDFLRNESIHFWLYSPKGGNLNWSTDTEMIADLIDDSW